MRSAGREKVVLVREGTRGLNERNELNDVT